MSNQVINSTDKDFNKNLSGDKVELNIVKRKVHGMAETEPKKIKLDIYENLNNSSEVVKFQQVVKARSSEQDDSIQLNENNNLTNSDLNNSINLSNLNCKSVFTSNGRNLNNNNFNTLNLNDIVKSDPEIKQETDISKLDANIILNSVPSHVVHLRNVPNEASENEILNLGSTFGTTIDCLILKGKNQAFIEFSDIESAKSMINFWNQQKNNINVKNNSNHLITLRGRQIFVQYSNHKKLLKTNDVKLENNNLLTSNSSLNNNSKVCSNSLNLNEDINASATNDLTHQQNRKSPQPTSNNNLYSFNSSSSSLSNSQIKNSKNMGGNFQQSNRLGNSSTNMNNGSSQIQSLSVLRVVVDNMIYLVPLETFHDLFSRFGKVTKIVTFNKNGIFQALIQFEQAICAASAKVAYDGQQMFPNGNLLRIEYSKLSNLSVKYNNEKSRDFTNSSLPVGPSNLSVNSIISGGSNSTGSIVGSNSIAGINTHLNHQHLALAAAASAAQQQHYQHLEHVLTDPLALTGISGFPGLTNSLSYSTGLRSALGTQGNGTHHNSIGTVLPVSSGVNISSVLLVSNLNEQMATPDALFTLFGVYGDVIRVKILFNKKDNALVQMAEPTQAQLVINYLDKIILFGNVMRITISKYSNVQMPKEGQPDSGLTKDYTNSPLHRFKKPGSKNYHNIFPPSATLHLSNIPSSCTEQNLREAFENIANVKVINFKFFPSDQKMALIQLVSIEDAVSSLIKLHNYQLSESNHLRVSFSKSSI